MSDKQAWRIPVSRSLLNEAEFDLDAYLRRQACMASAAEAAIYYDATPEQFRAYAVEGPYPFPSLDDPDPDVTLFIVRTEPIA